MTVPATYTKTYAPNDSNRDKSNNLMFVGGNARYRIQNTAVIVSIVPVALPAIPLYDRLFVTLQNQGNEAIFIGDETVTTSNGIALLPFAIMTFPYEASVGIYGVCVTGPATCICHEGL